MEPFVHQQLPTRVVFGAGRFSGLAAEVDRLGLRRIVVVSTPAEAPFARRAADAIGDAVAAVFTEAAMHVPIEVADGARRVARDAGADGCVAVGGGSTIGLAKAIALTQGVPIVAVPTTYAGSEMTPVWGLTEDGVKRTGRDPVVAPRTVIYDPELSTTLPVDISVASGMNAIAHAAEALYAPDGSPVISLMAQAGIGAFAAALPRLRELPQDVDARAQALYGAWLCGTCLGSTTMSLHHKLCHVLGGALNLPHAETHTVLLPHVVAFNAPAAPAAAGAIAQAVADDDPAAGLQRLAQRLGAPTSLAALGVTEAALDRVVELALRQPYANPRPVTEEGIRSILDGALHGEPLEVRPQETR